jgi:hypothetical protein
MNSTIRHKRVFVVDPTTSGIVIRRAPLHDTSELMRLAYTVSLTAKRTKVTSEIIHPNRLWDDISSLVLKDGQSDLIFTANTHKIHPSAVNTLCTAMDPLIKCITFDSWLDEVHKDSSVVIPPESVLLAHR